MFFDGIFASSPPVGLMRTPYSSEFDGMRPSRCFEVHLIVPVLLVPCWAPFGTAAHSSALQRPSPGSVASHRTHARPLCLEQLAHGALRRLRCSSKQLRASSIHCIHRLKMLSSGVGFETAAVASNTRVSARRSLFYAYQCAPSAQARPNTPAQV